jgi:ketosteroid isomerase-like protein
MTPSDFLKLHEQIVESWNRHDVKKFISYLDENIMIYDPTFPKPFKGRLAAEQYFNGWVRAFPDFTMKTLNPVISSDYIAVEVECSGTHLGPLTLGEQPEIPATNKKAVTRICFFAREKNGKVAEVRTYPDMIGLLVQLGLYELAELQA